MKRIVLNLIAIHILMLISSCNYSNSREFKGITKVKPEKTTISGDLSEYIQVVENEYEVVEDWGGRLAIKVKALKLMPLNKIEENNFELSVSLQGINGIPISGIDEFKINYASEDKLKSLLKFGLGEEIIFLETLVGGYDAEKYANKVKLFSVFSTLKKKEEPKPPISTILDDDKPKTSKSKLSEGSKDWDKMLDNYEEYVDEYIKFYKKAMEGDLSAFSLYSNIMEKATKLQTSMLDAQNNDELNLIQIQRMIEIQLKMTNAILEM
jgi:hypothetical protein